MQDQKVQRNQVVFLVGKVKNTGLIELPMGTTLRTSSLILVAESCDRPPSGPNCGPQVAACRLTNDLAIDYEVLSKTAQ